METYELHSTHIGSLQEVTVKNFFSKTNSECCFQHQDGIKKKPREKAIVTASRSGLVPQAKITYGDF